MNPMTDMFNKPIAVGDAVAFFDSETNKWVNGNVSSLTGNNVYIVNNQVTYRRKPHNVIALAGTGN